MKSSLVPQEAPEGMWSAIHAREVASRKMCMSEVAWLSADGDLAWVMGRAKAARAQWHHAGYRYGRIIDEVNFHPDEEEL